MPLNEDLLLKLKEKVLSEPASFDMGLWKDTAYRYLPERLIPTCKTVGCFAGWTCMISDNDLNEKPIVIDWEGRASRLLGLNYSNAHDFFHSTYWPFKFREAYHNLDIKISHALEYIRSEELEEVELTSIRNLITKRAELGAKVIDYLILHDGYLFQENGAEFPDMQTMEL